MCREKRLTKRLSTNPLTQTCTHTPNRLTDRQTNRERQPDLRDKSGKTYISRYLHNREIWEKKQQKPQ